LQKLFFSSNDPIVYMPNLCSTSIERKDVESKLDYLFLTVCLSICMSVTNFITLWRNAKRGIYQSGGFEFSSPLTACLSHTSTETNKYIFSEIF